MTSTTNPAWRSGQGKENPFETRLRLLTRLGGSDIAALLQTFSEKRQVRARSELVRTGDRADRVHLLLDGWAARTYLLPDGRRQIATVLITGDICDLDALHLRGRCAGLTTLTPCTVAFASRVALRDLVAANPGIADALGWFAAVDHAMLAERNASLGRRSAREHLGQFLCELQARLRPLGQADDHGFTLPITQEEIADTLGLTAVHVNRMFQDLRTQGLIDRRGRELILHDLHALRRMAGFRPDYLHLEGMDGAIGAS